MRNLINKKEREIQSSFALVKSFFVKITAFSLMIALVWNGLAAVITTSSYYSDIEESLNNNLTAGILDFELSSSQVFSGAVLSPGESVTGTISVINLYNTPKYKLRTVNFSGGLCDYLNLEANLDGGDIEYSGKLTEIDVGPFVFESPDDWYFVLSLPSDVPEDVIGETCNFNFEFYGSQVRNDLPFGMGFTDDENADNNLKALMCFDSETRSKGYWVNHLEIAKPYFPQMLGSEIVNDTSDAYKIFFTYYSTSMRNRLKGQLLAMKLNVAHFGMGEYIPEGETRNVNEIIIEADALLKEDPAPPTEVLEEMKDLLEGLAQDLQIRVCTETGVKVLIPNGGEQWWVGNYYDLTWFTKNLDCPNDLVHINIWYSKDSGNTWGNIILNTEDDGVYNWRIPLYLENNTYYTPSDNARIKVVAVCSETMMVAGWDMSDYDFCPPIDYSLLTDEERAVIEQMLANGTIFEADIINREAVLREESVVVIEEEPVVEEPVYVPAPSPSPAIPVVEPVTPIDPTPIPESTPTPDPVVMLDPVCGDGILDSGEECDGTEGVSDGYTCNSSCVLELLPYCGDNIKNGAEECDGTEGVSDGYTCNSSCVLELIPVVIPDPVCGDGILDSGEECDGTEGVSEGYTCNSSCVLEAVSVIPSEPSPSEG